jgi:hypothetical protein
VVDLVVASLLLRESSKDSRFVSEHFCGIGDCSMASNLVSNFENLILSTLFFLTSQF